MPSDRVLFVHGGPGLNSNPEASLMAAHLSKAGIQAYFWHEPSTQRPHGHLFRSEKAYENWLESLNVAIQQFEPNVLLGLSFGALGALDYLAKFGKGSVQNFVMVAPTLNMNAVYHRMMTFSEQDYCELKSANSELLASCRKSSREFWDEGMQKGVALVWQNPRLLSHYFVNPNTMQAWVNSLSTPEFQIDVTSQNAVLKDLAAQQKRQIRRAPIDLPLTIVYGTTDPVFDLAKNREVIAGVFADPQFLAMEECGHFPHLERSEVFLFNLKAALKS